MTYSRIFLSILIGVICSAPMVGQDGSTAYNFLNLPTSTHIYGLGGVNISTVTDDINVTDKILHYWVQKWISSWALVI